MRLKSNICRRFVVVKILLAIGVIAIWWYWYYYEYEYYYSGVRPAAAVQVAEGLQSPRNAPAPAPAPAKAPNRHITKMITILVRQFEHFENDIVPSVQSILTLLPNIQIVLVADETPYPAFEFTVPNATLKNLKIVNMGVDLRTRPRDSDPFSFIRTKYVLFVPDSMRISSRQVIQQMLLRIMKRPESGVAVPFSSAKFSNCQKIDLNLKEWSLKYENVKSVGHAECDSVPGKHAILLPTELLRDLPKPFLLPFPESLYLQLKSRKIKVSVMSNLSFSDGRALFRSQPSKQRFKLTEVNRRNGMYQIIGVKKVIRESGSAEWYGCTRDSERCFPPVVGTPSYLLVGRWTPPCCLSHLRRTLKHVADVLQQAGARIWLEGATLLGAVRHGDILPWAANLEIGIRESDIPHVQWLLRASNRGGSLDAQGFLWEKATRGDYYRVLFSKQNRLHVNVLPFKEKNGTMTKDTWFVENQCDFPDHFLHPMSSIELAGKQMPCPNNVRDFLELKFGKGIIERTKRPGSDMPYP